MILYLTFKQIIHLAIQLKLQSFTRSTIDQAIRLTETLTISITVPPTHTSHSITDHFDNPSIKDTKLKAFLTTQKSELILQLNDLTGMKSLFRHLDKNLRIYLSVI